jgi:VanZ family protein
VNRVWALRAAFTTALLVQFWALYVPRAPDPGISLPVDKGVHAGLFLLVTWLGVRCGVPRVAMVWFMFLQAAVSELTQLFFLPGRGGDWGDFMANLVGIALALALLSDGPHRRISLRGAKQWYPRVRAAAQGFVLRLRRPRKVDLRPKAIAAAPERQAARR